MPKIISEILLVNKENINPKRNKGEFKQLCKTLTIITSTLKEH